MPKEQCHPSTSDDAVTLTTLVSDSTAIKQTVHMHSVELDRHADVLQEINDRTKRLETTVGQLDTTQQQHTAMLEAALEHLGVPKPQLPTPAGEG